jgi:hypothetical protein
MKAKSALIIACMSIALVMAVGVPGAQADCCFYNVVAAPFVAAGWVVATTATVTAAVVTAPFRACCGGCAVSFCNPCCSPGTALAPGNNGRS